MFKFVLLLALVGVAIFGVVVLGIAVVGLVERLR